MREKPCLMFPVFYVEPQGENVVCVEAVPNGCCPILTVGTASVDLFPFVMVEGRIGALTPVVTLPMPRTWACSALS